MLCDVYFFVFCVDWQASEAFLSSVMVQLPAAVFSAAAGTLLLLLCSLSNTASATYTFVEQVGCDCQFPETSQVCTPVLSMADCAAAATALSVSFDASFNVSSTALPGGCYLYKDYILYFNNVTNVTGKWYQGFHRHSICDVVAAPTTTAQPLVYSCDVGVCSSGGWLVQSAGVDLIRLPCALVYVCDQACMWFWLGVRTLVVVPTIRGGSFYLSGSIPTCCCSLLAPLGQVPRSLVLHRKAGTCEQTADGETCEYECHSGYVRWPSLYEPPLRGRCKRPDSSADWQLSMVKSVL